MTFDFIVVIYHYFHLSKDPEEKNSGHPKKHEETGRNLIQGNKNISTRTEKNPPPPPKKK